MPPAASALAAHGFTPWLAALLARRGVDGGEAADRFLRPSLDQLHDPFLLAGMEEAVSCLHAARERGDGVALVGDYDVDGVTATALLLAVLRACGLRVEPILPHRLREGYGFQPVHVERALASGCRVVLTADCGSSSLPAIEAALAANLAIIITDHHRPGCALPSGVVQINPQQDHCSYPFAELAAVGLALKLAQAVAQRCGRAVELAPLLRIACLGTIADVVPLTGENRVIAALGLAAFSQVRSLGLRALLKQAGLRPPISASQVAFRIGPRLNAAGRLHDPQRALDLLMSRDQAQAEALAAELETLNRERQAEEAQVVTEARKRATELTPLPPILVLCDPGWHRGVLGIAAGRLAREFHRPALLLAGLPEAGELATGSGRSVPGIDLHAFLAPWTCDLERFGGHGQAVGLTVATDRLDALRTAWEQAAAERWAPELLTPRHVYELELPPAAVTVEFLRDLSRLEPFGEGNPRPLLRSGPLTLVAPPRFFGTNHLAATGKGEDGGRLALVGFGWAERVEVFQAPFEVLGHPEIDDYTREPVLRLVDCRPVPAASQRTAPASP